MTTYTVSFSIEVEAKDQFEAEEKARALIAQGTEDIGFRDAEKSFNLKGGG